jgi:hypothetical protein
MNNLADYLHWILLILVSSTFSLLFLLFIYLYHRKGEREYYPIKTGAQEQINITLNSLKHINK